MVELYGLRTDWYQIMNRLGSEADYVRDLLATFDTEREAQAYVKASELVNNSGGYPTYNIYRKRFRYRAGSLLRHYTDHEICSSETVSVPHNPSL